MSHAPFPHISECNSIFGAESLISPPRQPISPICRTPLFPISQNLILLFRRPSRASPPSRASCAPRCSGASPVCHDHPIHSPQLYPTIIPAITPQLPRNYPATSPHLTPLSPACFHVEPHALHVAMGHRGRPHAFTLQSTPSQPPEYPPINPQSPLELSNPCPPISP